MEWIGLLAIPALAISIRNAIVISKKSKKVDNHGEILKGSEA